MESNTVSTEVASELPPVLCELSERFGNVFIFQPTADRITTLWLAKEDLHRVLGFLKSDFPLLFDLTAVDERLRTHRSGLPDSAFTVIYHLLSFERNEDIRLKVALSETCLSLPSIFELWPSANWYEREVWDMFGIVFDGHPNLRRIVMPPTWVGHPLRKEHPARATEMEPFSLSE